MVRDNGNDERGANGVANMVRKASQALVGFSDWDRSSAGSRDEELRRTTSDDVASLIRHEALKWTNVHQDAGHKSRPPMFEEDLDAHERPVRLQEDAPLAVHDLATLGEGSDRGAERLEFRRTRELSHQQVVEKVAQERASRMLDRATHEWQQAVSGLEQENERLRRMLLASERAEAAARAHVEKAESAHASLVRYSGYVAAGRKWREMSVVLVAAAVAAEQGALRQDAGRRGTVYLFVKMWRATAAHTFRARRLTRGVADCCASRAVRRAAALALRHWARLALVRESEAVAHYAARLLAYAAGVRRFGTLRRAFAQWSSRAHREGWSPSDAGCLMRALAAWRALAASARRARRLAGRMWARGLVRLLHALLRRWLGAVHGIEAARGSALRVARRVRARAGKRALAGWRAWCAGARGRQESCRALLLEVKGEAAFAAHGRRRLSGMLEWWARVAASRGGQRQSRASWHEDFWGEGGELDGFLARTAGFRTASLGGMRTQHAGERGARRPRDPRSEGARARRGGSPMSVAELWAARDDEGRRPPSRAAEWQECAPAPAQRDGADAGQGAPLAPGALEQLVANLAPEALEQLFGERQDRAQRTRAEQV